MLDDQTLILRTTRVVASAIDGHLLMMTIDTGRYYRLNEAGRMIWSMIELPMRLSDLTATLTAHYEASPVLIDTDIRALLTAMAERGVVEFTRV